MSNDSAKSDRKKVAVDEQTYDKLRAFSRLNAVKTRIVLETLINVMLEDPTLAERTISLSLARQADESD